VGKPVVGITTYLTNAAWSYWQLQAALIPASYVESVERAGGSPLLVPPGASIEETLDVVDGIVFSGGSDIDPELYGADAHETTSGVVRERDEFELELMRGALDRDLPVLAICRGSQVLNVARRAARSRSACSGTPRRMRTRRCSRRWSQRRPSIAPTASPTGTRREIAV